MGLEKTALYYWNVLTMLLDEVINKYNISLEINPAFSIGIFIVIKDIPFIVNCNRFFDTPKNQSKYIHAHGMGI